MYNHETQGISSSDQGPPCSAKDHHHGGPGGWGDGVQGGPLQIGGGPYESGIILNLSNKTLESASIEYHLFFSSSYFTIMGAKLDREKG